MIGANLVVRARQGDSRAFEELVRQMAEKLYAVARRLVGTHADAEDVLQQTFLRTWQKLPTLREPAKFEGWVYMILLNEARMHLRFRQRWRLAESEPEASVPAGEEPGEMDRQEALQRALSKLTPEHREVVILHDIQDLGHEEIAEVTGVSIGTVWSRLHYARKRLRLLLGGALP